MTRLIFSGGEKQEIEVVRAHHEGPYVLIFGLDGVGYDQMMEALRSGSASWISALLGAERHGGLYEHAYAVPNAVSILPSTTIPGWSSIFTGLGPAYHGVAGNEWFEREEMRFLAPAPVSVKETDDTRRTFAEDLVGKALHTPTLFERVGEPSYVSLNQVHHGADIFTIDDPAELAVLTVEYKVGTLERSTKLRQDAYAELDLNSVPKVVEAIKSHGVPTVQVVYFPGIDLYTHIAENPLIDQVHYLQNITFPSIATVLSEYRRQGALDSTYVIFVSDHGHTPVLADNRHALGVNPEAKAPGILRSLGFRVRPEHLEISKEQSDFQAVLAYQDAMAYVYLADRSACAEPGQRCKWDNPPRFEQDVMPVVRALYHENLQGTSFPAFKDTLDLVFARKPVPVGQHTHEYEIYDGSRLIPISQYLKAHPRPDLVQLDRRMRWLAEGPYGHHAGDVLLLAKSGLDRPIEDRYYFSHPYSSQHGSASQQDSHIVLILSRRTIDGRKLRQTVAKISGDQPSYLDVVSLVRALLSQPNQPLSH